jgi:hypothetical protein
MTKINYLKTEKFKDLASEISNVTTDLRLIKHTFEFVRNPDSIKNIEFMALEYVRLYKYVDELYNKVHHLEHILDNVSSVLYSVDSLGDLKTCVADEDINYLADKSTMDQ